MKTAMQPAPGPWLKTQVTTTFLALSVLAGAVAVAAPQTDSHPVTRSAKVSLADLDLSTPQGASVARERLLQIARRLCARVSDELDLSHQANYVACVDETLAAALRRVNESTTVASATNSAARTSATAKTSRQPAHSASDSRASRVSLDDLDLTTPEGARVARERLHQEARRLCRQVEDELDLSRQQNFVACVDETLTNALRQVPSSALVAGAVPAPTQPVSQP